MGQTAGGPGNGDFGGETSGQPPKNPLLKNLAMGAAKGGLQSVAQQNAQHWNAPGGGFQQWQTGDPQREQQFPIGTPVDNPALPRVPGAKRPINPFYGGQ